MPIHHVTYAMPNARNAQRKLYICYKGAPTQNTQTTGKRAKERETHKLPLNTCTRAKEHTKLTLHTWDRAKSKRNQVAWPRPHTWRSQIRSPLSFINNSLILVHHPRKWCTYMSPLGREAKEPPPISTKCSPGHPPATQNQEGERANDSTLGLVPKV
jgi:hypothetical protein